jgi:hypothetical protein
MGLHFIHHFFASHLEPLDAIIFYSFGVISIACLGEAYPSNVKFLHKPA